MRLDLIYDNLPTKIRCLCLFLLLFAGCSDEISKESYTSETVIDDLADKITWRKDGKEMKLRFGTKLNLMLFTLIVLK